MKVKKSYQVKGAVELIEEAVHLLRAAPLKLLAPYYIGSLPFILGLLFFWSDMSQNAFAADRCAVASLGMALLFFWMKIWQSVYVNQIREQLIGASIRKWKFKSVLARSVIQTIIQPTGLIYLFLFIQLLYLPMHFLIKIPVFLMIMVPFGWYYAFYQNVSVLGNGQYSQTGKVIRESWAMAKLWNGQNHLMLLIIFLFSLIIFLNIRTAITVIPYLLKIFFDLESQFTISGPHLFSPTLSFIACSITYLCADPLVKTLYTLRCFYGKALYSGADLNADLDRFRLQKKTGMLLALLLAILLFPGSGQFIAGANPSVQNKPAIVHRIQPQELDRSIQEVMEQRQFTWRMPREKPDDEPKGFLGKIVDRVNAFLKKTVKDIMRAINRFFKSLRKLFPEASEDTKRKDTTWIKSMRIILYFIVALLLGMGFILGFKLWKKRKNEKTEGQPIEATTPPDLNNADVDPLDFDPPYWLALSDQLLEKGSLRLALRAVYLGMIAYLAEKGLISAAKYKSNRDYFYELKRREHALQELVSVFDEDVKVFDRIWYGMKAVYLEDIERFRRDYERITRFAQV